MQSICLANQVCSTRKKQHRTVYVVGMHRVQYNRVTITSKCLNEPRVAERLPFDGSQRATFLQEIGTNKKKLVVKTKFIRSVMQFLTLDSLYFVLMTWLVIPFLLNRSNLTALVSVCLT